MVQSKFEKALGELQKQMSVNLKSNVGENRGL